MAPHRVTSPRKKIYPNQIHGHDSRSCERPSRWTANGQDLSRLKRNPVPGLSQFDPPSPLPVWQACHSVPRPGQAATASFTAVLFQDKLSPLLLSSLFLN
ncbi:hypothetical protein RRG08_017404 [Elysia crispata]|uniref:Uncharacterized protein n=1 Tax=Elysia crispata TaxID=231223 RepID=A0AAE0ZP37_9GAST|nr:hypothetical protein RRG08_017404 [Elysia crispata]